MEFRQMNGPLRPKWEVIDPGPVPFIIGDLTLAQRSPTSHGVLNRGSGTTVTAG